MTLVMSGVEHTISRWFRMDDRTWERHASPWSVWTRVASLPLLLAAIWSHTWLGLWSALPIAAVTVWLWINPRLFPAPARTDSWSAKATFGERVWLNRTAVPIPAHHARLAALLSGVGGAGFMVALVGAVLNDFTATLAGGVVAWSAKMWFCDRMVWLYEDMRDKHPAYAGWLRTGSEKNQ